MTPEQQRLLKPGDRVVYTPSPPHPAAGKQIYGVVRERNHLSANQVVDIAWDGEVTASRYLVCGARIWQHIERVHAAPADNTYEPSVAIMATLCDSTYGGDVNVTLRADGSLMLSNNGSVQLSPEQVRMLKRMLP